MRAAPWSRRSSAMTSGIPKLLALIRFKAHRLFFIRPRLVGLKNSNGTNRSPRIASSQRRAENRVGREGDLRFWDGSFVADPFGEVIARASRSKEEVLMASLDLRSIRASQEGWRFLHNRRPQSYGDLVR